MIIFGQGAIRCHPYVLKEMAAPREPDHVRVLREFDAAFFGHASFLVANAVRSFFYALGGSALIPKLRGAELKRRERLSARLGDILSQL